MVYVKIAERIQNFNLQNNMYPGDGASHLPETYTDEKCSFFQSMLLSNCGKFVVVKPNTLVILCNFPH